MFSGLSLAMMNENDNTSPVEHAPNNSPELQPVMMDSRQEEIQEDLMLPFGSPVTRAAFHNPPPMYHNLPLPQQEEPPPPPSMEQPTVGSAGAGMLSGSPRPPLMSTPPTNQGIWPSTTNSSSGRKVMPDGSRSPSDNVKPTYPAGLQPLTPSHSRSVTATRSNRSGTPSGGNTPPTTASGFASRHMSPLISSPNQYHRQSLSGDAYHQQQRSSSSNMRRTSSSSVHLLPPVTSLDILHKSPFAAVTQRKRRTTETAAVKEGGANQGNDEDVIESNSRQENEVFLSSIPQMVSNDNERSGSIAVSTLGGGGSSSTNNNPFDAYANSSAHRSGTPALPIQASTTETDELPFAVDDDNLPPLVNSASPSKSGSRSLWGSTKADVLDGTIGGTGGGAGGTMAEITSSLAVSSLHH